VFLENTHRNTNTVNELFRCNRAVLLALDRVKTHAQQPSSHAIRLDLTSEATLQHVHSRAMHLVNQYLRVYERSEQPLTRIVRESLHKFHAVGCPQSQANAP
jgi:hypothetical protein